MSIKFTGGKIHIVIRYMILFNDRCQPEASLIILQRFRNLIIILISLQLPRPTLVLGAWGFGVFKNGCSG